MSWDGIERRRHRRYGVKGSTLRWRPGAPLGWVAPASAPHILIDLCPAGCRFISKRELAPGRALSLAIEAPPARATVRAAGRVAWSRRSEELDAWHTGISMKARNSGSAERLKIVLDGAVLERIEITTRRYLKEMGKL
ncbi:MAG TPA: PilZ domain-containing protein [Planctomycetota bacterium]|nr:PilZ domain-containing protein [Planctomycetota bacterium]